jgi:hypothetical protein
MMVEVVLEVLFGLILEILIELVIFKLIEVIDIIIHIGKLEGVLVEELLCIILHIVLMIIM